MKDDLARFHTKYVVNEDTGCWNWIGPMHPNGYGQFGITVEGKGVTTRAHRFSFEKLVRPIEPGMMVLHRCDNRKCVNPDHLFSGEATANMQDCVEKGRHWAKKGMVTQKLTQAMVQNIRIMYARGLPSAYGNERNRLCIRNIASIYGVEDETVRRILKGGSHLHF